MDTPESPMTSWPLTDPGSGVPVVVLGHEEPGGCVHWDLLVPVGSTGDLQGWRCRARPDRMVIGDRQSLVPLGTHRRAWLYREGPVSGQRGHALRVNAGRLYSSDGVTAYVKWTVPGVGDSPGGSCWRLEFLADAVHLLACQSSPSSPL